ncbi:MAG: TRAP transporter large permease subunit [Deltaproteobacteria bacterium]|nr:TRAP transporter large permease subunit [Deltaproteobacteria bacterium]
MLAALLLLLLALVGTPLFVIIAAAALWGFHSSGVDLSVVAIEIYRIAETPVLLAIPLFTFAGYLLSESQAPQRLMRLTQSLIGWLPGGLAIVSLGVCAVFTAFTGASGVTIIALGALLYPAMEEAGYPQKFNLGLVTTSGSLGLLFAPSLPLILYGIVAQQMNLGQPVAIEDLFLAGIFPGLLMLVMLSAWSIWTNRGHRIPLREFRWREVGNSVRAAAWELPLPVFVLGGIYGGFFAVSEAAAMTALYVLIVEVLILREIPLRRLPAVMRKSMVLVGGILVILAVSLASANYMIDAGIPNRLFEIINAHVSSRLAFLVLLNIFLLALGALLDIFSALVLVVPLILPVAVGYGIHPVHLGIIFLANMQIGYLTPPVGLNLFISGYRFNKPISEVYWSTLPFFVILLCSVLVITYWPALSLVLLG